MKKEILFVIPSMRSGGAEKSLLTLFTLFDFEKYNVDLLCFRHDGLFFNDIPKQVNIIRGNKNYEMFDGNAVAAIKYFFKKGRIISAVNRVRYSQINKLADAHQRGELQWSFLKKQLPKINKKYDCAIGYLEGNANRFVAECVTAEKKICYIHNDIEKLGFDKESFQKTFYKADMIVTVSAECENSLRKYFPQYSSKFCVIENITSSKMLFDACKKEQAFSPKNDELNICTVGRFSEQKNIELAVASCAELVRRGLKIKWYHIGSGELRSQIEKQISENGVTDCFCLLGEKSNPYPYIGQCDVYVQPSRFEGKSIAIDEAKCLCRPIVVTNFSTVHDQIEDGVNGLICEMNEKSMADKIEMLINDETMRRRLSENLKKEKLGNEEEILKLYELIDR